MTTRDDALDPKGGATLPQMVLCSKVCSSLRECHGCTFPLCAQCNYESLDYEPSTINLVVRSASFDCLLG